MIAGAAVGAGIGAYQAWHGGGNAGQIVSSAILGGVSGFFGGVGMWGSALAVGAMGAFATGGTPAYMKLNR